MSNKLTSANIRAGVIFQTATSSRYAYKLILSDEFVVDGSWVKFWIYRAGMIADGKFVEDKNTSSINIDPQEGLVNGSYYIWEPEEHKEGDLLVANDGTVVVVGGKITYGSTPNVRQYWYVRKEGAGWDKLDTVVRNHGKLSPAKAEFGKKFTGVKAQ